eukprot:g4306.t1
MAQAEEIRTETGPLDYDYTEKEVELCQENLQNHKACSPDKIKNEMLNRWGWCRDYEKVEVDNNLVKYTGILTSFLFSALEKKTLHDVAANREREDSVRQAPTGQLDRSVAAKTTWRAGHSFYATQSAPR